MAIKPKYFLMKKYFWEHFLYFKGLAQSCLVHTTANITFACHMTADQSSESSFSDLIFTTSLLAVGPTH